MHTAQGALPDNMRRGFACIALIVAACFAMPAAAHPLGNFTINHLTKIRTSAREIRLTYVLDIAEIPTFQIMRERAIEGPQRDARLKQWADDEIVVVTRDLRVTVDGQLLELQAGTPTVRTRPGAGSLPILYWVDELSAALPAAHGVRHLNVADGVYAGRIGWKDIVIAPDTEPTRELTAYPNVLLGSPRDVSALTATIAAGGRVLARATTSEPVAAATAGSSSQMRSNTLSDMLAKGATNPWLVLLTLLVAIGLGALHALEPGHGKTLLAVSLVGARATTKQALILAVALTFAHTAGVLALGLLMLVAAQWIVPENIYPWITLASGAMVAVLGANALSRYIKIRRGEAHAHDHDAGHDHAFAHDHSHADHQHVPPGTAPLSFGSVVLVAMSGNIAPCPAALVVLLAALTLHQLAYGLLVIVAFSIGLASVLTGLGIALVHGASWLSKRPTFDRAVQYGPLVSASVIALIGAIMLGQGAFASSLHAPAIAVTALVLAAVAGYALAPGHLHTHAHHPVLEREAT